MISDSLRGEMCSMRYHTIISVAAIIHLIHLLPHQHTFTDPSFCPLLKSLLLYRTGSPLRGYVSVIRNQGMTENISNVMLSESESYFMIKPRTAHNRNSSIHIEGGVIQSNFIQAMTWKDTFILIYSSMIYLPSKTAMRVNQLSWLKIHTHRSIFIHDIKVRRF